MEELLMPNPPAPEGRTNHREPLTIEAARAVQRRPVRVGRKYTFYSISVSNPDCVPYSEQKVTVLAADRSVDRGDEGMYRVRARDGHEFDAFEGELNGFYRDTGQYVNHPTFLPAANPKGASSLTTTRANRGRCGAQ
jgi:hypothetical protein